jgi:hypothetical protein
MTDNEFGNDFLPGLVDPLILEIFLNNNNYKDRILISDLKRRARLIKLQNLDENSFFVKAEELESILSSKFGSDIREFSSIPNSSLPSNATSIYFLNSMLREFRSLRYFRIYVSNSPNYTRKVDNRIVFDYKIMHSRVDLAGKSTPEFLRRCKDLFSKIGIYREETFFEKPYLEISAKDLFNKLNYYGVGIDIEDEDHHTISDILMLLGSKIERDNSTILIIMKR